MILSSKLLPPDTSSTTALLQQLPLAMALPGSSGHATEWSETIAGLATEHSEEGRPPQGKYAPYC